MSDAGTRAIDLVRRAGIDHRVHRYELPEPHGRARKTRPAFGLQAAEALDVAPDRIYKTLVVAVDDRLVLAVVPVAAELDLKRLADACGGRRADLAEAVVAERATGYVIGGISPLGSRRRLQVVLDSGSIEHTTIYFSAGRRGLQLEMSPDDLAGLAGALVAPIARDY